MWETVLCTVYHESVHVLPAFPFYFLPPSLVLRLDYLFILIYILFRYPPGRFDYAQKQNNNCLHCQGCCNCTACCSKHGDEYVSSCVSGGGGGGGGCGPKKPTVRPPLALQERVSLGAKPTSCLYLSFLWNL